MRTLMWTWIVAVLLGIAAPAAAQTAPPFWTNAPKKRANIPLLADLADRARPAGVHVRGLGDEPPAAGSAGSEGGGGPRTSIGTGFLISKDGYLVSNEHVVRGV